VTADLLERPAPPARSVALRSLAALEARRYVRSPLFLIGVGLLVWTTIVSTGDLTKNAATADPGDLDILPAFCLGLIGVLVGHQLTRSLDGSTEALGGSPSDGVRRTAALCLACLVPGVVALCWVGWIYLALAVEDVPLSTAISPGARAAMLLSGVVCSVGGPLFGVLVARWVRFAGSALVAVVVLAGWTLLGTGSLALPPSRAGTLLHSSAPLTNWVSADGPHAPAWVAGGSPGWYLGYQALLCGLAVAAASLPGTTGPRRGRVLRVLGSLAVGAVVCLALAVLPDPARIPL
jgi:hypothetical protein